MMKSISCIDLKSAEPYILKTLKAHGCADVEYLDAWLWFPPKNYQPSLLVEGYPRIANLYITKYVYNLQILSTVRISSGGYEVIKKSDYPYIPEDSGIQVWLDSIIYS